MDAQRSGAVFVLIASAGFGTLAIFGKLAAEAGLNTTTLLAFRFAIGSTLLWIGLRFRGPVQLPPAREFRVALALGTLYAVFSALYFWGLLYVPAGVAGITFYTFPVFVYALSATVLDEQLTRYKLAALACAIAGVALMIGADTASIDAIGVLLILLAAFGNATYITGNRAAVANTPPDMLAAIALVVTAGLFVVGGSVTGRLSVPSGPDQWAIIVGIAVIGTAMPLLLYVTGLQRIEASRAAIVSTSEPVVTVLLGIIILDELLTPAVILGGGLVLVGVLLAQTDVTGKVRTPQ